MITTIFKKTLVIGLGLIGGSFAKACKQNNISEKIYAFDLDMNSIELAKKSNLVEDLFLLDDNLEDFDFIVLATPLSLYKEILQKISHKISIKSIIIDLGSVKSLELNKILPQNIRRNFIPCHPIAGSEKNGFENSETNLFYEKKFIICPENCNPDSLNKVQQTAEKIGSIVEFLDAKKHDEIYALVSHLPQFLSFLTTEFSPKEINDDFFNKAFRLNNSDPRMWEDIFKINEKNLEKFYLEFFDNLEKNLFSLNNFSLLEKKKNLLNEFQIKEEKFDEIFFSENFSEIFFRNLVVISYLEIKKMKEYLNYAGKGFKDFTSIIAILNFDDIKIKNLLANNNKKITKIFSSIS